MRFISTLLFVALASLPVKSQNNIDSLKHQLELVKTDTEKVNLLNKIANEYTRTDLEKSFQFSSSADSISSKIGYTNGKAESHRILGVYYVRKSKFALALQNLQYSLRLFEQTKDLEGEANSLLGIGSTYIQMDNKDSALYYYQKSLVFWLKSENINKERIAAVYNNLGILYKAQENLPMALEYYQKSLRLREEINDKAGVCDIYNNLGIIYNSQKDYERSIESYKKSIAISNEIDYKRGKLSIYHNIAIAYLDGNVTDSAIKYANESLKINLELDNKRGLAFTYNTLGDIYLKINSLNKSIECYEKGVKIATEIENNSIKAFAIHGIGAVRFKQQYYQLAYSNGKQAFNLANELYDFKLRQLCSELLANTCAELGKHKEAFEFHKIYKNISDSILNESKTKKIVSLEYEYKFQKEKIEQDKKNLEQQTKLTRQKQFTLTFIIGFCLVLLLGFLVFTNLRRKQRDYAIISNQKNEIEHSNVQLKSQKEEIESQNEILVQQAKMLAELDEMKSQFFANISHELKTPLTLITLPLAQIIETNTYEKATFEVMYRNAKKLQDMIDELLQLARMERGFVDFNMVTTNINVLIKGVLNSFEGVLSEKQLGLQTEGLDDECMLTIDSVGIEKVVSNLLSNAIKFTPNGKRIKIASCSDGDNFSLCVSDEGIGIPQGETNKIFDRFYRASNSQKVMGTGIGLSLASDIVTLHGGTITAGRSEFGGAEFIVIIPSNRHIADGFEKTAELNVDEVDHSESTATSTKRRLLIVEDNQDLRNFLVSSFSSTYHVIEAENGKIGLQVANNEPIDIIVSDIMMPEMDGYTLTKTIRNNPELCHIPIILLTAKSGEQSLIKGLEHEADAYITKPFSLSYLKAEIANQLNIRIKLQAKFQKEMSDSSMAITMASIEKLQVKFGLSNREKDLAILLVKGLSNQEIADKLFISLATVKTHSHSIYQKTGTKNKLELRNLIPGSIKS